MFGQMVNGHYNHMMEEHNIKKEIKMNNTYKYRYFYDFDGYIITAAVRKMNTGYYVGFAFCSKKDKFVKSLGRKIAEGRISRIGRSVILLHDEFPKIKNSHEAAKIALYRAVGFSNVHEAFKFPRYIVKRIKEIKNGK